MTEEPQLSVSDQMGKRTASGGCSDFHIRHMASVWYPETSGSYVVPTCQMPVGGI